MTTLKQIREAIHPGQWAVSLDIKSAYCHIPIARRHQCFLHFHQKGKVYQFKTLPFGVSTAPKNFTRIMKPILHLCQKMGITIFLYLDDVLVLATSHTQAKEEWQRVMQLLQKLEFVLRLVKGQLEPTPEFTYLDLVFNTQNMNLALPWDKVLAIKAQAAKVASSPTCRGVMRLLDLTHFASMALTLAILHSQPLQYWVKENYKTPADLFKGLKTDPEAAQTLLWWHNFKPQPKSISRPLIEAGVTTGASKEGYGGHMNNLPFWGRWPAEKAKNTHINILELETVWIAYQRFEESLTGKTVSFQIDNTTAVAYLLKEGGTHYKTLNSLVRKILLKCHENVITVCPEYFRGVANLQADALSRDKKAQEWSLGDPICNRLFKCWGTQ